MPVRPGRGPRIRHHGKQAISDLPVLLVIVLAAQLLIMYWAGNHTCRPERGFVISA
jgi:hypothetical protein